MLFYNLIDIYYCTVYNKIELFLWFNNRAYTRYEGK